MKGTVIIDLEELLALKESNSILLQQYLDAKKEKDFYKEQNELIKTHIMQEHIDYYNVERFDLEELLDDRNWRFPFSQKGLLLELGITLDEMKEFIKGEKAKYGNE